MDTEFKITLNRSISCVGAEVFIFVVFVVCMPPPRSGEGHIVLPSVVRSCVCVCVRPSATLYSTVCVSATPPSVFKRMV